MDTTQKFNVGDRVTATEGPMKNVYGTVVLFDRSQNRYLVRYGEKQQLYFQEDQLRIWDNQV
ncbi:hypothetical protein GCM10023313_20980 [Mucilaginibacter defluvii]|uniref:Uncharacterized protein n=1 Tax=Mucilaginibacter defluvii TaxID=1196019 RepID=A0ABP9FV33_9SPHI